jgi:hypothetical protein
MNLTDAQTALAAAKFYAGKIDGRDGPMTQGAVIAALRSAIGTAGDDWPADRRLVGAVQAALNALGHEAGAVDGRMGPKTSSALTAFRAGQSKVKWVVADITNFKGAAKRLDAWDFGVIGRRAYSGEDEMRAVVEVEAAGSGFDPMGRPKMLFEPHVFWRELGEQKRRRAEAQGLAYRKWKSGNYPRDSYPRLMQAIAIDRPAALRSASWGLGQIMGFNHKLAGYHSAESMIEAFLDDEEKHLEAMLNFIVSAGLDDELRAIANLKRPSTAEDWAPFALGYNGSGFRTHGYHTKLAAAHARWKRIPDVQAPA